MRDQGYDFVQELGFVKEEHMTDGERRVYDAARYATLLAMRSARAI
jgi:hypothetical protein